MILFDADVPGTALGTWQKLGDVVQRVLASCESSKRASEPDPQLEHLELTMPRRGEIRSAEAWPGDDKPQPRF